MSISRPYVRNCRMFLDGTYSRSGTWMYIQHPAYAKSPEQYIRAFKIILKDLQKVFDYVEPADINLKAYSFRIHELLMRVCIEVEANFKAILLENEYQKDEVLLEMKDYKKIEKTHRLSSYQVKIPHWYGTKSIRTPFRTWSRPEMFSPAWYQAYNKTKHNRHEHFHYANFENLIDATCGLVVLLSSQFLTEEFSSEGELISIGNPAIDGMESAIGKYFKIKFPDDWPNEERYDFAYKDWQVMAIEQDPFQKIDYMQITI